MKEKEKLLAELNQTKQRLAEVEQTLKDKEQDYESVLSQLRQDRKMLDSMSDNLPAVLFVKDKDYKYLRVNQTYLDIFHLTIEQVIGKSDYDIFPKELADNFRAVDSKVFAIKEPIRAEEIAPHEEGIHHYLSVKFPLFDEDGECYAVCGIATDITNERKALEEHEKLQKEIIEAQQRAIKELATPVIPVIDGIIVMPLVGSIDSLRAKDLMRTLLAGISQHQAQIVILDLTGVSIVDTGVVNHLNKTIQAAQLKGAKTIVTGIADSVAETIVDLGIDWRNVMTLNNLQTGLMAAFRTLGLQLNRRIQQD